MRIGSKIAAAMPLPSVTYMARRASPTPRKMPVVHMPSATIGVDGITICRKRSTVPASRRWRRAPNISRRNGQTAAVSAVVDQRHEHHRGAGQPRGSSRLPRPSERETSAEQAMVRPIDTEMVKNSSVAAKPIAAVERLHAEQRDVEQVERIDDEDGDQPDRAGRRHDDDMAHRRAGGEFRSVSRLSHRCFPLVSGSQGAT